MRRGPQHPSVMSLPLAALVGAGSSKTTSQLRRGGCGPFPERQVPLRHPRSIPPHPEQPFNAGKGPAFAKYFVLFTSSTISKPFGWSLPGHLLRERLEVSPVPLQRWEKWGTEPPRLLPRQDRLREIPRRQLPPHRFPLPVACKARKFPSPGQENPLAYSHGANNENTNYISLTYQGDDSFR